MKKVENNVKKLFTKKEEKYTIGKDYNPLKVNYEIYGKGSGLFNMEKEILKEIKKGLNLKERIIVHINRKTFIKIYNKTRLEIINKLIK